MLLETSGDGFDLGDAAAKPYMVSLSRKLSSSCDGNLSAVEVSSHFNSCTNLEHFAGKGGGKGTSRGLSEATVKSEYPDQEHSLTRANEEESKGEPMEDLGGEKIRVSGVTERAWTEHGPTGNWS